MPWRRDWRSRDWTSMVHSEWDEKRKGRWELGQVQGDCQSLIEFSERCRVLLLVERSAGD